MFLKEESLGPNLSQTHRVMEIYQQILQLVNMLLLVNQVLFMKDGSLGPNLSQTHRVMKIYQQILHLHCEHYDLNTCQMGVVRLIMLVRKLEKLLGKYEFLLVFI